MVEILLPEKEVFDSNVSEISKRIDSMSESNTMARLLHSNFKNWLSSSSMSPVKLTQDLDADKNGVISGDEFAELLNKVAHAPKGVATGAIKSANPCASEDSNTDGH